MARKSRAPTINDVASLAGVSRATASRALAGYGRISPETEERVKKAAQKIGYRPNEVARAMRAGKTRTIGLVVISDFTNAFFDRATKAIIDAAREFGYQTVVFHTDEELENERRAVETLVEKRVDGLIVVPSSDLDHSHLSKTKLGGTPLVLIDRTLPGELAPSVTTGDYAGAVSAVDFAYSRGHRQMGFVIAVPGLAGVTSKRPRIPISTVVERTNGFEEAEKIAGVSAQMIFCDGNQETVQHSIRELLQSKNRPSIIFTSNNDMLLAALRVAGSMKLGIGTDLSLISFDDSPWAAAMTPSISVISRPVDDLGSLAVQLLMKLIDGESVSRNHVLPTDLILRESVATVTPTKSE